MFATRALPAGFCLLQERPLLRVATPASPARPGRHLTAVRTVLRRLSQQQRDMFWGLGVAWPRLSTKERSDLRMMDIFQTNCWTVRDGDKLKVN